MGARKPKKLMFFVLFRPCAGLVIVGNRMQTAKRLPVYQWDAPRASGAYFGVKIFGSSDSVNGPARQAKLSSGPGHAL